jgi:uncharacterized membrane protein
MRLAEIVPVVTLVCLPAIAACGGDDETASPDGGGDVDAGPDAPVAPGPGITFYDFFIAVDVTPDGRTAAFESYDSASKAVSLALVDTWTGEARNVATIGDPTRNLATGISSDRRVTAFHGDPSVAGVWSEAGGWLDLPSPYAAGCDQDVSSAWDVSADGMHSVGMAWNGCAPTAVRWDGTTIANLQVIGAVSEGVTRAPTNRATVISDDGRVAAGFAEGTLVDRQAALWNPDGSGVLLEETGSDAPSEVLSINADGTVVAGIWGMDGFFWARGTGMVLLRRFENALPSDPVYPNAMTADGTTIFGGVGDAFLSIPTAFRWTAGGGMVPLVDVATAAGITLPEGTILNSVLGASADGHVLVGTAMDADGNTHTYVLRLPPT